MLLPRKDFIGLIDVSAEEIKNVLDTAETMKHVLAQKNKKAPYLQGKSVILLFYEDRSRTKVSYELAGQYLSASIVDMTIPPQADGSDSDAGGLIDMGRIVDQMGADFIIIRHPMAGSARYLAESVSASVINAGDGFNENPSQALLDLMTIKRQKGGFEGLNVTFVGDILNSRLTKSNIWGLLKLGAKVRVAGPPTLIPPEIETFGVEVYHDAYEAVQGADVIMSVRLRPERFYKNILPSFNDYNKFFKIDETMLQCARPDAIVMHPGPINRGVEISSKVIESDQCLVNDQISNGVAVRMALLYLLGLKGGKVL